MTAALLVSSVGQKPPPTEVTIAYTFFLVSMYAAYYSVGGGRFSAIMTLSVMFQCLAVVLLGLQSLRSNSAEGISAKALVLEAVSLGFRLSSTLRFDGYLPSDHTGDFLFQAVDVCSLALVLCLLHRVLVVQFHTYQASEDSFPIIPVVLGSLLLATGLHGDMNSRPLFDTLWMAGVFIGVAQVLPQLWLITRQGFVDALTGHYVAALAVSKLLSGAFMWYSRMHITSAPWVSDFNHAPWVILAAHACHLLLLADFGYYWAKAVVRDGFTGRLELPAGERLYV